MNWREVIELVRPAILDIVPMQRPDIVGEKSARDRLLFSTDVKDSTGVLRVGTDGTTAWLLGAELLGVGVGDRYNLVRAGRRRSDDTALDRARSSGWTGDRAILQLAGVTAAELPLGRARPSARRRPRPPARGGATRPITPPRPRSSAPSGDSRTCRCSDTGPVMATVQLDAAGAQVLDAAASR